MLWKSEAQEVALCSGALRQASTNSPRALSGLGPAQVWGAETSASAGHGAAKSAGKILYLTALVS